ncbi:uncharacterized protein LOC111048801 isoform X2 [Nilaparvata lugens]|uniref:uncharacterized protein LOC111048801 isoform X2 n=1 Tax=Nilaparvata lugens TaxID=108931 RepID=UPI000B992E73|nr:uncharacterized protein LOC111048801 isoform X2 [Nilaparvata lugens]
MISSPCRRILGLWLLPLSLALESTPLTPPQGQGGIPPFQGQGGTPPLQGPTSNPEGYYAFVQSSKIEPPTVRPPPYFRSNRLCPGVGRSQVKTLNNLCGDLNKGYIPMNPMRQNVYDAPYPFDVLKNKTLEFLSRALPILQADETLPKVAKYQQQVYYEDGLPESIPDQPAFTSPSNSYAVNEPYEPRATRGSDFQDGINLLRSLLTGQIDETHRQARKFCENGGGVLCMLYKMMQSGPGSLMTAERRDDDVAIHHRGEGPNSLSSEGSLPVAGPPTPCPAKVEYATPVFARNYQGIWRYVVQIPYEGYFTQTVEVTRCLQSKCFYMEGGCLSSPRWISLLVAEIFYPDAVLPTAGGRRPPQRTPVAGEEPPNLKDLHSYGYQPHIHKRSAPLSKEPHQSHIDKRSAPLSELPPQIRALPQAPPQAAPPPSPSPSSTNSSKPSHCDGIDEIGCFQVRLYYDWFLVPGSCKCWRPDYFSRFTRKKPAPVYANEL